MNQTEKMLNLCVRVGVIIIPITLITHLKVGSRNLWSPFPALDGLIEGQNGPEMGFLIGCHVYMDFDKPERNKTLISWAIDCQSYQIITVEWAL